MTSTERTFLAYLDEMNIITILLPLTYHQGISSTFSVFNGFQYVPLKVMKINQIDSMMKYVCQLTEEITFGKTYWIIDEHGGKTDLQIGAVIRTEVFDEKFYYDGYDLGVVCQSNQTRFKLWAPTATQVKIKLRSPNSDYSEMIKMIREDRGVWSFTVNKDLELYQYTFLILVNREWREAVDPYVKAVTANGEVGVVVKLEQTSLTNTKVSPLESPVDAIIYEAHIRDLTIHPNSGLKHKGLYLGVGEQNTKGKDGELTGLSYLKDLGITHLELLPFNDFAGVNELERNTAYNWGYNPIHFNVPEGSYSTDPSNPYSRIIELKQMIENIHQAGLRVIMDVVYNHVYIRENSSFEKIVPGYYFRQNEFGQPSNGTGVGNDVASERKMVRKFILDSVQYWLEEYQVDGFRFDLMGILDIDTMNEVKSKCEHVRHGVLLLGEGWNLNTPLAIEQKAIIRNQAKIPQIAQFNDRFRDTIKGSTFNLFDKGYCLGNDHYFEAAGEAITGSIGFNKKDNAIFREPFQSVNYIECHDNHTVWDKITSCLPDTDEAVRMKYHRLATGIVILSQGIPFLHSGQEFFRTKYGEGNSYRSPDSINQLDWDRKSQYKENVNYIKELIQIRKTLSCFRMRTTDDILSHISPLQLPPSIIGYLYQNKNCDFHEVILLCNPLNKRVLLSIPEGDWCVFADQENVGIPSNRYLKGGEISIEPICLMVLGKN